jgi:hypothetical protein
MNKIKDQSITQKQNVSEIKDTVVKTPCGHQYDSCESIKNADARFEVFTAVKSQVKVFWVVTLCSVAVGDQCFRSTLLSPSSGLVSKTLT